MKALDDSARLEHVRFCKAIATRAQARIDATISEIDALIAVDEKSEPPQKTREPSLSQLIERAGASLLNWVRLTYYWRMGRTKRWWRLLREDYRTLVEAEHADDARHKFWHDEGVYRLNRRLRRRNPQQQ